MTKSLSTLSLLLHFFSFFFFFLLFPFDRRAVFQRLQRVQGMDERGQIVDRELKFGKMAKVNLTLSAAKSVHKSITTKET